MTDSPLREESHNLSAQQCCYKLTLYTAFNIRFWHNVHNLLTSVRLQHVLRRLFLYVTFASQRGIPHQHRCHKDPDFIAVVEVMLWASSGYC